jgi:endogenous inhibitor of DNA gyrase (YacG/DUF329 family)
VNLIKSYCPKCDRIVEVHETSDPCPSCGNPCLEVDFDLKYPEDEAFEVLTITEDASPLGFGMVGHEDGVVDAFKLRDEK